MGIHLVFSAFISGMPSNIKQCVSCTAASILLNFNITGKMENNYGHALNIPGIKFTKYITETHHICLDKQQKRRE
jgi:hypothetical protein